MKRPFWAIVYTLDYEGQPRKTPFFFPDTVSLTRREAWAAFDRKAADLEREKRVFGAKAIKVRLVVVA